MALTVSVFRVMTSRSWMARYQNSEEICYLNLQEQYSNTLHLKCQLWKLLSFGRRHVSTLNKDAVGPPPPPTLVPLHPTTRLHIQDDSNFQRPEWFVQLLRLEFKITWTQAKTCFLCLLPRQGFGWQWGPWSFECPCIAICNSSHKRSAQKHTDTHTQIRVFWHSRAAHGTASEFLIIHGNFSGQPQWQSSPLEAVYQILIEEYGFRTAHTSTQHNQPVTPAVHRHETVLCRLRTSICKKPFQEAVRVLRATISNYLFITSSVCLFAVYLTRS